MLHEAGERTQIASAEMLGIIKGLCLNLTANKLLYNKGNCSLSSFLQNTKYTVITIKPNYPAACELCACACGHHVPSLHLNPSLSAAGK